MSNVIDLATYAYHIELDNEKFNKGINDSEKEMDGFKKSASGIGDVLKGALSFAGGMAIFDTIKEGFKNSVGAGWEFNKQMEDANMSFKTMLGSADKATKMLDGLKTFAAKTPFELTDLAKGSQTLLAFGQNADSILPNLKMLGDVSLGNKDKFESLTLAFAQVQSTGKLMGQDLLQFINAGFNPLQIISEKTGKSMAVLKDEMSQGAISANMVSDAFKTATSEGGRFYNSMDNASKTFGGQMSTLRDNISMTFGQVLQPAFDFTSKTLLPNLIGATTAFQSKFAETGSIAESLKAVFENVFGKGTLTGVFEPFKTTISTIKETVQSEIKVVSQVFDNLKTQFEGLAREVMPILKNIFNTFTTQIIPAFANIHRDLVEKVLPPLVEMFGGIVSKVMPPIIKIFEFVYTKVVPELVKAFKEYVPIIGAIMKDLKALILPIVDAVVNAFKDKFPFIKDVIMSVVNSVTGIIGGLLNVLGGLIKFLKGVFTGDLKVAFSGIKQIFEGLGQAIGSALKLPVILAIDFINNAIRSLNKLKIDVPDWVPVIGGKKFGLNIPQIPKFEQGINYVPNDMLSLIHKGEAVVPAQFNPYNPNAKQVNQLQAGANIKLEKLIHIDKIEVKDPSIDVPRLSKELARMTGQQLIRSGILAY